MAVNQIKVRPVEDEGLYRWYATSETDAKQEYLVDLLENDGAGWCGCQDFQVGWGKARKIEPPETYRCKHLRRVRMVVAYWFLNRAVELESSRNVRKKT